MQLGVPAGILKQWQDLTGTLAEVIGSPAALIKRVVGPDIEVLVATVAPGGPYYVGDRQTLAGSGAYCESVINHRAELTVADALANAGWKASPDAKQGFIFYCGLPILWPDGSVFGTICLLDTKNNDYPDVYRRLMRQSLRLIEQDLAGIHDENRDSCSGTETLSQNEETLRLSEERFRLLIEHAADDFFLHDSKGRFLDVNQRACESTGYSREELLQMNVTDLSSDLSREEKEAIWQETQPGNTATVHSSHRRKDGSFFPVEIRISCYLFRGEKLFLGMVRDITERVEAERAIHELNEQLQQRVQERTGQWRESLELLQSVMNGATDAIFLKDLDGKFLLCNRAAASFVGCPASEIIGKTSKDLFGESIGDIIRGYELQVIESDKSSTTEEIITANGVSRLFLATRSPYRDEEGNVIGLIGISRDITETRLAEEALHASEARWQFAVDGAGDGIWDWNVRTGKVFYSQQWKAMLGYSEDEVGDTTDAWSSLIHPEDLARCWQTIEDHFEGDAPVFILEHRMLAKDGTWRWILDRGKIVERSEAGLPLRVIGTHTDISGRKALEEQLAAREQWLTEMVENLPIGAIFVSGDQLRINLAGEKITGYSRHELPTPDEWFRKLWGDMYEQLMTVYLSDRADNFSRLAQVPFYRKDGSLRLAEFAATVFGEHEIWLMRDVTEDKELQKQLSTLTDNVPNGAIYRMVRTPDGQISYSYISAGISALIGVSATDATRDALALRQTIHEDDFSRVLKAEESSRLSGGVFNCQYRHRARDGRIVWLHSRSACHSRADGATVWDGVMVDITARKQAEDGIIALNERFQLATQAGGIGIWELDLATNLLAWDERMYSLYGLNSGEFDGSLTSWLAVLHPEDEPKIRRDWEIAASTGSVFSGEFRVCVKGSDEPRYIRAQAQFFRGADGELARALGINWDVTERRRAVEALVQAKETAEAAERAKGEFLAMMSHEVRTPMNTVIGMTHLVLQTDLTAKQRNYLDKIDASGNSLIAILNDILDFSKIEAGKLELEEVEFPLQSVLESVSIVTAMKAEEKSLEIAYDVSPDVPDRLVGDPLRLGQVLINLVNNAVKFTREGEIVVSIERAPKNAEGVPMLQILVRDSGIGLEKEQIATLFRDFSQAESNTSRRYGGTGLGLAICKRLVELMGGSIGVSSVPGQGSTFFFTIEAKPPAAVSKPLRDAPRSLELSGKRVLVVDDNASARDILGAMVRHFGMETVVADSGPVALAYLKQAFEENHPFELVLMDWRMPGMDGLETAYRIKTDLKLSQTPAVLMVTAYGREDVLNRAQQLGLQGVLIKPVTESILFDTIANVFKNGETNSVRGDEASSPTEPISPTLRPHSSRTHAFPVLKGKRVLVVEDNAFSREVVSDFLVAVGVHVETATNGLEALARLEAASYDAVLMDMHMPEMDGLSATQEIRRHEHWKSLPIIALTAQTRSEERKAGLAAGMTAHLTKPINETILYTTLSQLLSAAVSKGRRAGDNEVAVAGSLDQASPGAPAIDLSFTLERLGGERDRLSRLLKGFVREFRTAPAQLAEDYRRGRTTAIADCAHAVRGAASYLEARELCDAGQLLEDSAREGDLEAMQRHLPIFVDLLKQVLQEVDATLVLPAGETIRKPVDISQILDLIGRIEPLVAGSEYAANALFDDLNARLAGTSYVSLAEAAHVNYEELELDAAAAALLRLRAKLELEMSGELS